MKTQSHKNTEGLSYKGIPVHAAPGLHEAIIAKIQESNFKTNAQVLELGCGSGALTLRLCENDFRVRAVDQSLDSFTPQTNAEAEELDLNKDFSEKFRDKDYDLIVAVEVIEHLENPQHFLRQVAALMSPETRLWISFPNMFLYINVWKFPKDNTVICWNIEQYWEMGHQTMLPAWLFEQHLTKAGLSFISRHFVAPLDLSEAHPNPIKRLLSKSILKMLELLIPTVTREQRVASCVLYEIRASNDHEK